MEKPIINYSMKVALFTAGVNYLKPIFEGIAQGFLISILSIGPSFFSLIQTGLREGFKKGFSMAMGIFFSEFVIALLYFFGLASLFSNKVFLAWFSLCAGSGLIILGVRTFRNTYRQFLTEMHIEKPASKNILRGFLFNLINPATLVLWLIVISGIAARYSDEGDHSRGLMFINMMAILVTIFAVDTGKVFVSHRIGRKLKHRVYYLINRYFGMILTVIGAYFIYRFLNSYGYL